MATKKYLDYAGLKRVLAKLLPGARKIWHGESDDWDALAAAEREKYDQAEVIDDGNSNLVALSTEVRKGDLNPVTSDAVAGNVVVGEYATAAAITVPVNSTFVNYLKINLKKGKWIIHARARTNPSSENNVLLSMYVSSNPDVTQGNATMDQRAQLSGIWHFVNGFLPMTLAADATLYIRLTNNSTIDAVTTIEGSVYAVKVAD